MKKFLQEYRNAQKLREAFEERCHQGWNRCEQEMGKRGRKSEEHSWRVERADRDRTVQGGLMRSPTGPCPSLDDQKENVRGFRERFESRRVIEYKMDTRRIRQEEMVGSSRGDESKLSNDSGCGSGEAFHGIEELCRRGDFANWKTAMVKKEGVKRGEEYQSAKTQPPAVERDEDEEIQRLHRFSSWKLRMNMFECLVFSKVRDTVCYHLNHYWPEAKVIFCNA